MNKKASEAYCYYKRQSPDAIVLFRVGDNYVALSDDARRVKDCIPELELECPEYQMASLQLPVCNIFDYLPLLGENGVETRMVECRDDSGRFDFPDMERLKDERSSDY